MYPWAPLSRILNTRLTFQLLKQFSVDDLADIFSVRQELC